MNRPSDDSFRRINPVQFWELLHKLNIFFSETKHLKLFFFGDFFNFFDLKKKLLDLTMKKQAKNAEENTQA